VAKSAIIFSTESWKSWCLNAGLEKEIVPAGLRINDSNLVLEAVRLGLVLRWSAVLWSGTLSRGVNWCR
jgi:hypothetical protein